MKNQMLQIAGHKNTKDFYAEFPDEESFMKVHGKAFNKARLGERMEKINYGDKYSAVDLDVTGMTQAQRNMANMPVQDAPEEGKKKGSSMGEIMGTAKTAYGLYQGMSGGGASSAGSAASSMGSSSGMMSGIMSMFKKNGGPIKKAQNGTGVKAAWEQDLENYTDKPVQGPQNQTGGYYQNNNPYFTTNPGPTSKSNPAVAANTSQGTEPVSSVSGKTGASAQNAPGNGFQALDPVENKLKGWGKTAGKIDFLGISGKLITGIGALKAEKEMKKRAMQARDLSELTLQAAKSTDIGADREQIDARARQREIEMPVNTGEEFFPIYGNGKEVLAKDGIHIKQENKGKFTAYKERTGKTTEEALHSSNAHVRQMANFANNASKWNHKGSKKAQMGGSFSNYTSGMGGSAAGGAAGGAASGGGTPWGMIGTAGGGIAAQATGNNAGGQIGGTVGEAIGTYWGPAGRAIGKIAGTAIGGLVDTNPKKMKKYNKQTNRNIQAETAIGMGEGIQNQYNNYVEYGGKLKPYKEGGNISGDALDGQLETHWGGKMDTLSNNPYLPNSGETAMFRGASHDDGGIGATYAGTSVEAEGGEPVVELPDPEGGNSAVVFGNLKINKESAALLGDNNATNKKFKNYVEDLSKKEANSTKIINNAMKEYADFDPITPFDKLKENTLQLNVRGSDMKLKAIAHKKETAAHLQSAINDSAAEHGLSAEHLAVGKYKKASKTDLAEFGKRLMKAQDGKTLGPETAAIQGPENERTGDYYDNYNPYGYIEPGLKPKTEPYKNTDYFQNNNPLFATNPGPTTNPIAATKYDSTLPEVAKAKGLLSKENIDKAMTAYNQVLPYVRKSDAEGLDPNQLTGENYALSHNKLEPVYAKGYNPQLDVPYDITLQEMRNENRASTRSAERLMGYNPAAASNLASESYAANQKIGAEEFRMNQARRDQSYNSNRATENDAKLKNMGIYDQQYTRQEQAKSNTKAITQAALNSISDKFAKNKLENRTLQTYENLYNYRFDNNYRAQNENGLHTFNTQGNTPGEDPKSEAERISDMEDQIYDYNAAKRASRKKTPKARDGSIIQSLKRL